MFCRLIIKIIGFGRNLRTVSGETRIVTPMVARNHCSNIEEQGGRPPTKVIMTRCERTIVSRHAWESNGSSKSSVERKMQPSSAQHDERGKTQGGKGWRAPNGLSFSFLDPQEFSHPLLHDTDSIPQTQTTGNRVAPLLGRTTVPTPPFSAAPSPHMAW